jgi:hypothetical protein
LVAIARNFVGSLLLGTNDTFTGPAPPGIVPPLIVFVRCSFTDSTADGRISVFPFFRPPFSA